MCKDSNDTVAREPYLSTLKVTGKDVPGVLDEREIPVEEPIGL